MINVMYIVNDPSFGGAAQSFIDMLPTIRKYINPVVIIIKNARIIEKLQEWGIVYYEYPLMNGYGKAGTYCEKDKNEYFINNYEIAKELSDIIKKYNVQLVHTNSSVCNVGQFTALMNQLPHVWHVRELLQEHYNYEFWDADTKQELFQRADKIIAISECVKKTYKEKYNLDLLRLYNGFNVERFYMPVFQKESFTKSFLLAGAISEGKGQWDAIKAVELLVGRGWKDVELVIVGNGNFKYVWSLKQYIKQRGLTNNIHIYSFMKDLKELRKRCAYAITSSKMEALGRVTVEAMLSGNLVIGANTGGTLELIGTEQKRGYLYEQGNVESLASVMLYAINDNQEVKHEKRECAQRFVMEQFNNVIYAENLYKMYQELLQEQKRKKEEIFLRELEKRYYTAKESITAEVVQENNIENKFEKMFMICNKWLSIRQNGHMLEEFFVGNDIKKIAIYGMGFLGQRLYTELENGKVEVVYTIDRDAGGIEKIIKCINPIDNIEEVDAIVVTVIIGKEKVEEFLNNKCDSKIINITEIIDWQEFES